MKISQLPKNKMFAYLLTKEAYNMYIGGLENSLMDYDADTPEYNAAYKSLYEDPENTVNIIYEDAKTLDRKLFTTVGEEWTKERIARRLKKDGYFPGYVNRKEYDI